MAAPEGGVSIPLLQVETPRPCWDLPELGDGDTSAHTELKEQRMWEREGRGSSSAPAPFF